MLLAARNTFAWVEMASCYFSKCVLCCVEEGIFERQSLSWRVIFKGVSGYTGQMSIDSGDAMAGEKCMQMAATSRRKSSEWQG